jgi:hypothetical protein
VSNERERLPGSDREQDREQGEEQGGGIFDGPQGLFRRAMAMRHQQRIHRKKAEGGAHPDSDAKQSEAHVSQPGEAAEQEADQVADHVAEGLHGDSDKGEAQHAGKEQAPAIGAKLKDGAISLSPKKGASPNQMALPGMGGTNKGDEKKKDGQLAPHPDKRVDVEGGKYILKPEWRDCIREKFYGSKYRTAVNEWLRKQVTTPKSKGGLRHETDPNKYFYAGQWYENSGKTRASVGHEKPPVAQHWNEKGHKTTQAVRVDYFNGDDAPESNLLVQPCNINSSEGASKADRYTPEVTIDFRGP